ncbi:hypothetical protein NMG60_11021520 [Bertholletia excelsa]
MERSEPTLIPEWLKGSGNLSGGGSTTHQMASSSLYTDDNVASKPSRNKSLVNINDHDIGRSSLSDRTTSYYHRSSSSNGSAYGRSYGSSNRGNRDREWEKEIYDSRDKERSVLSDHRRREYHDSLDNILSSRFEKDLRRSKSMITGKRVETWPKRVSTDLSSAGKSNPNSSNGLLSGGSAVSTLHKAAFERDFPSLGTEERQAAPEIGRVSSPGLSTAIQSLPIGSSSMIGGDGWTSALAEVPVCVSTNGVTGSVQQTVPPSSTSLASSMITGLNMAETLAQSPSRANINPQVSSGTQRLEELAIKQSRQLIPMTPTMPKALTVNPSDKSKSKGGQQQQQISPRGGLVKSDASRTSSVGKLHVLKPVREKNGLSPTAKDNSSPTSVSRVSSNSVIAPPVGGTAPLKSPSNNSNHVNAVRKPSLEKRPTPQSQSRNDFFNLMRRKSVTSNPSAATGPGFTVSSPVLDKSVETRNGNASVKPQGADSPILPSFAKAQSTEKRNDTDCCYDNGDNDIKCNGDPSGSPQEAFNEKDQELLNNGRDHSSSNAVFGSEEEEAAFLRSLGWEENAGEDEGLTEEEISSFYRQMDKYTKLRPSSRVFQGMQPKFLAPLKSHTGTVSAGASSGSSSSDSKMES